MHPSATPIIRLGRQEMTGGDADLEWGAVEGLCIVLA